MKWVKPSPELTEIFYALLPTDSRVEKRKMFGYPCAFTNCNMFCGMHGNKIVVRLPEIKRTQLIAKGWKQFEPMPGRIMKEYLVLPDAVLENKKEAKCVISESLEYAFSMPQKKKK